MLGARALGERGLHDGRSSTARGACAGRRTGDDVGRAARTLRHLGGVGCTGCHGPGAMPEPTASRAILRATSTRPATTLRRDRARRTVAPESTIARSDVLPHDARDVRVRALPHDVTASPTRRCGAFASPDEDDLHARSRRHRVPACHTSHALHDAESRQGNPERDAARGGAARVTRAAKAAAATTRPPSACRAMGPASASACPPPRPPRSGRDGAARGHRAEGGAARQGRVRPRATEEAGPPTTRSASTPRAAPSCHATDAAHGKMPERPDASGRRVRGAPWRSARRSVCPRSPRRARAPCQSRGDGRTKGGRDRGEAAGNLQAELVLEDPAARPQSAFARTLLDDATAIALKQHGP